MRGGRFKSSPRQPYRQQSNGHLLVMRGSEVRILSAAPLSPAEHCPPTRHAWVGGSNPLGGPIIASRALSTHSSCVGRGLESSPRNHIRQQSTVHPLFLPGWGIEAFS